MKSSITTQTKSSRSQGRIPALLAIAILALGAASPVLAGKGKGNPGVLPPQSNPYGKSYGAWGAELSNDYAERSRITGVREIFTLAGLAFASAIPLIAALFVGKDMARGGYWFAMEVLGWTIMLLTPIGVGIMFWSTPEPPIRPASP